MRFTNQETCPGVHSLIFQCHNSYGTSQLLSPIRIALSNWEAAWQVYAMNFAAELPHNTVDSNRLSPNDMWKRTGFCRYSPEFWLLAYLMVERLSTIEASPDDTEMSGDRTCLAADDISDLILKEYDQTSMRQVNDLILRLQQSQIS